MYREIDTTYFVLSVDLWSADGSKEVNLVRHSSTSPSISATTASSYPPPPTPPPQFPYGPPLTQVHIGLAGGPYAQNGQYAYSRPEVYQGGVNSYAHAPMAHVPVASAHEAPPATQSFYTTSAGAPLGPTNYYTAGPPGVGPLLSPTHAGLVQQDPRSAPGGMFTRNLIGSLCVSAFKLTDPEGAMGIWFILQDLSVRTEGSFRCVTILDSFVPRLVPLALGTHSGDRRSASLDAYLASSHSMGPSLLDTIWL